MKNAYEKGVICIPTTEMKNAYEKGVICIPTTL